MARRTKNVLDDAVEAVRQLRTVKQERQVYEKRYQDLRKILFGIVEAEGVEDANGHIVFDLPEEVDETRSLIKQKRTSVSLDHDKLEALLKEKGLYEECTKTVTVLDEEAVNAAVYEDKISEEEFEECVKRNVSWSLVEGKA